MSTVNPTDIAVALGRTAPSAGSPEFSQWVMWISDAEMLIETRRMELDPTLDLDALKVDYVVREAVVAQVRRPDEATQVTVSVDDGSTSRTYQRGRGRISILDEWWVLLGLSGADRRAFEVDTAPPGSGYWDGDVWVRRIGQYWTSAQSGRVYASSELGYLDVP